VIQDSWVSGASPTAATFLFHLDAAVGGAGILGLGMFLFL